MKTMNTLIASNWAERDEPKEPKLYLKIANSRGRKPVMRDLKKARDIISGIIQEVNSNDAKDILKDIDNKLWAILHEKANN